MNKRINSRRFDQVVIFERFFLFEINSLENGHLINRNVEN